MTDLARMNQKLDQIEKALKREGYTIPIPPEQATKETSLKVADKPKNKLSSPSVRIVDPKDLIRRDDMKNPFWIEDEGLGSGEVKHLKEKEVTFWCELIEKYLKPLEKDVEKEKQAAAGLKELRNSAVFSFLMINSIWVLTIFLLQENKDLLYIRWPFAAKGPILDFDEDDQTLHITYEYLQLEPIGLLFVVFFAVVLIVQFVGMLLHRIMTLGHIVSTTKIRVRKLGQKHKFDANALIDKQAVDIVKSLIKNVQPGQKDQTIEEAVEESMTALAQGDENELRRMSEGTELWNRGRSVLKRTETIKALRHRASEYNKRKATMKRPRALPAPGCDTIEEDNDEHEQDFHIPVVRTNTYTDPDNLDERDA